jgi:small-conductance mechanosensitive channel
MEHFETFQAVMDEYNEAYTAVETAEEQEAVNLEWEAKIKAAEDELEEAVQKEFEEQNAALEAEQKEFEKALEELEKEPTEDPKDEWEELTVEDMMNKFKKKENLAKAKELGLEVTTKMKELEICKIVYNYFNE